MVISQRFCQMMGGDIQVESVSGQGTTFIVYLPVYMQKDIHEPKIEVECLIPSINSAKVITKIPRYFVESALKHTN